MSLTVFCSVGNHKFVSYCILYMEAKIDNFSSWVHRSDPNLLKTEIEAIVVESGFTVLNFMEHHFEPQGYTAMWLLAESHCALHTFPEEGKSYIEISSCNTDLFVNFVVAFNRYQKSVTAEVEKVSSS